MAYSKTAWKDRIVQKPLTYNVTNNLDGTITLVPAPGTITQAGTPVNAVNLNNLETQYDEAVADSKAVSGTFTGDNAANKTINLGFTPTAVIIFGQNGSITATPVGSYMQQYGGLAVTGAYCKQYNGQKAFELVENGFKIYKNTYVRINDAGNVGHYIAFK